MEIEIFQGENRTSSIPMNLHQAFRARRTLHSMVSCDTSFGSVTEIYFHQDVKIDSSEIIRREVTKNHFNRFVWVQNDVPKWRRLLAS